MFESFTQFFSFSGRYAGMLKSHKQNLVPESEFHIREERVKAQKTDEATKPNPTPAAVGTEKTKKEKESSREKEERLVPSQPDEKPPQPKVAKVKGAATAAEARAAAEKEKKETPSVQGKEKGEGSKSPVSGGVAAPVEAATELPSSTPNPELPAATAARKSSGNGSSATSSSSSAAHKTKTKVAGETKSVENGGHSGRKSEGKEKEKEATGGRAAGSGEKAGGQESRDGSSEKRTGSKGTGKTDNKTPKGKAKHLGDKSDGAATPGSRSGSPLNVLSPATRGAKGGRSSPAVSQNGPTATPSPRAGKRGQLSETEVSDSSSEKGRPL